MKRKLIFVLALLLSIISCEKGKTDPEPDNSKLSLEIVHGNNQTGFYNLLLQDSLVVKATDNIGNPVSGAPINFEIRAGSSDISPDWVFTDSIGLATVKWTIGCNSDYNELEAYLNNSVSNKIDSVTFFAYASLPDGWGKSCGIEDGIYRNPVFREHNGIIYIACDKMIYKTSDGGISWQEIDNMPVLSLASYIFDIQFNSKGWMYLATDMDGIFYTEDYATWDRILLNASPTTFLVEDTCIFASFNRSGLYRSSDNGQSWSHLLIDGKSDGNYFINRHPNGDLYLLDNWPNLWHSTDNGDNWNLIPLEYKYTSFSVKDFIIDEDGNLIIGAEDAKISILSSETYQGSILSFYERNLWVQYVDDIKIVDDIIYFTVNNNPEPGIYSSQNWDRLDLGFDKTIKNYHLKTDGSFLIASSDGVYYYNEP